MFGDLKNELGVVHLLEAKSQAAGTVKTALLDTKAMDGAAFVINFGVFVPNTANAPVTATLVEGDTTVDTDLTTVAAADLVSAFAGVLVDASNDQKSEIVGYIGRKRYVGINIVVPVNATSLLVGANGLVKGNIEPTTAPAAVART